MRNRAKCKLCDDIIESVHHHDYITCKCGEISVDGGDHYCRCSARNWENFIRSTPSRGTGSVSKLGLVGALLCLWHDCAGLEEEPRVSDCQRILKTIKLFEANPTRSFENSPWLMKRGRGISINPARTSHALEIAKNYCTANTIKG